MSGPSIPAALQEFADVACWVGWRYEERNGKRTKVPKNPGTGGNASSTDPKTWGTFAAAAAAARRYRLDGIGILPKPVGLSAGDLDHCYNPETGEIAPWAAAIVAAAHTYTQISPSGEGFRLFVKGNDDGAGRKVGAAEFYCKDRFLTVTDTPLAGTTDELADWNGRIDILRNIVVTFGEQTKPKKPEKPEPEHQPLAAVVLPAPSGPPPDLGDDDVIQRLFKDRHGAETTALWHGDMGAYADADHPEGNHSAADLALCGRIAFYTGPDSYRIDRIFRQSLLYDRDKWDRADYRDRTIRKALEGRTTFYSGQRPRLATAPTAGTGGRDCCQEMLRLRGELDQAQAIIATQREELGRVKLENQTMRTNHELERQIWHRKDLRDVAPTAIGFAYVLPASASHGTRSDGGIFYSRGSVRDRYGVPENTYNTQAQKLVARGFMTRDTDPGNDPETGEFRSQAIAYPEKRCTTTTEYLQSILELPPPKPVVDQETGEIVEPRGRGGNQKGKKPIATMTECPIGPAHEIVAVLEEPETPDHQNGGSAPTAPTAPTVSTRTLGNQNGGSVDRLNWGHLRRQHEPSAIVVAEEPCPRCTYTDWQRFSNGQWRCAVCGLPYPGSGTVSEIQERVRVRLEDEALAAAGGGD